MSDEDLSERVDPSAMLQAISVLEEAQSDPRLWSKVDAANQAVKAHIRSCAQCRRPMERGYSIRNGVIPNRNAMCRTGYDLMMALGRLVVHGGKAK